MKTDLHQLAIQVGTLLKQHAFVLAAAESCTGGLLSETITSVPDSSQWFDRGFITYSNHSKQEMLGVAENTIEQFDAVSSETVREMAEGALKNSKANIAIAITGYAGPTGGTDDASLGTVWFGIAMQGKGTLTFFQHFLGERNEIRKQAVVFVLQKLIEILKD